eukprot:Gb_11613 [translate_table: standard]
MSVFKIPSSVRLKLEQIQKTFLWSGAKVKRRFHLASWEQVCQKKCWGGLGLRHLKEVNKALLGKLGWSLVEKNSSLWVKILKAKYLRNSLDFLKEILPKGSNMWNNLLNCREFLRKGMNWRIGDGSLTDFWEDRWLEEESLISYPELKPLLKDHLIPKGIKVECFVNSFAVGVGWLLPNFPELSPLKEKAQALLNRRLKVLPLNPEGKDVVVWGHTNSGSFSVKSAYELISPKGHPWILASHVWMKNLIPNIVVFMWLATQNKILTQDNLV